MNYNLLLVWWLLSSIPFIVSCIVEGIMLIYNGKIITMNKTEDEVNKLLGAVGKVQSSTEALPNWLVGLVLSILLIVMAVLDGMLWLIKPYKQIRRVWNVSFWNFEKV